VRHDGKVFCVGRNKTGTTSLERALTALGYRFSTQHAGERLLQDWMRRDFRRIVELARGADAGQDLPYSLPFTYQALDEAFPGSKFVLTLRDSPREWYDSLVRFHARITGCGDRTPTAADLKRLTYVEPGWLYRAQCAIYGVGDDQLYDPDVYMSHYLVHAYSVQDYFRHRADQLLVLDVADPLAMRRLCDFLGVEHQGQDMPHLNRTR
jgi:hypothetical protein